MQSFIWDTHAYAVVAEVAEFYRNEVNIDCTFLVEGQYLKGHKVILCACSPYFQELFKSESGKKAISLKGVKYHDFKYILDFIYFGIVDIPVGQVASFVSTTKLLQIRGLESFDKADDFCDSPYEEGDGAGGGSASPKVSDPSASSPLVAPVDSAASEPTPVTNDSSHQMPDFHYVDINAIPIKTEVHEYDCNQNTSAAPEEEEEEVAEAGEGEGAPLSEEIILKSEEEEEIVVECSLGLDKGDERAAFDYEHLTRRPLMGVDGHIADGHMNVDGHMSIDGHPSMSGPAAEHLLGANYSEILRQHLMHPQLQRGRGGPRRPRRPRGPRASRGSRLLAPPLAPPPAAPAPAAAAAADGPPPEVRDKPYCCHLCPVSFDKLGRLREHFRSHTGEKPFKCHLCPQDFARRDNLKNHLKIHSGVKPFACPHCSAAFARNDTLKEHLRTHTGERPFQCPHCNQTFAQRSYFNCHLRSHLGQPFECTQCDAKFKFKHHLKAHLLTHTNEKAFTCSLCPAAFKRGEQLKKHLLKHK